MSEDNNIQSSNIDVKILPQLPPSPPPETENKNIPKLTIRTPSYVAFLNASLLASELDEKVQSGSYHSPSLMLSDQHSDLDTTSPKLKFKFVTEYIPHSPISTSSQTPISHRDSPILALHSTIK